MRRLWVVWLVPSLALGGVDPFANEGAAPVELGDIELEEWLELPISSVSLRDEKASQAPAAVFVLSGDDVRDQGFRTLGEILRSVPGLFVVPDTAFFNVGVRGVSLPGDEMSRFLVMVDGIPVNNVVGIGQSYIDRELPIGPQALERVEVIQGPIGGVYGPIAFMGAVNFVTKKARAGLQADVALAGEVNSLGVSGGELAATVSSRLFDRVDVLAHVGGYRSRGGTTTWEEWSLFADRPYPADLTVRGSGWVQAENVFVKLGWGGLSLTAGHAHKKHNIASYPYGSIVDDRSANTDNQNVFTLLSYEKNLERFSMLARAGFQEAIYFDDLGFGAPADNLRFKDATFDRWATAETRISVTPVQELRGVFGALGQYHWTQQGFGFSNEVAEQVKVNFAIVNVYALLEWRPWGERLLVQAGANWTWHQLYGQQVTPRAAAVLKLTPSTTAKAAISTGFRNPTLFEGYYADGAAFASTKSLSGDQAVSLEGTLDHQLTSWAHIGVTLFDTSYERLIRQRSVIDEDADGLPGPGGGDVISSYENLPSLQVYGAQLFADVRHTDVRLWGGVSLQDTRSLSNTVLPGFAHFTANLSISTRFPWRPLTLAASGVLIGPRNKPRWGLVPGASDTVPWGGSFQVSARLEAPWVKGLSLQLSVQNILGWTLLHPVSGDYAPITAAKEPELLGRAMLEWKY